MSKQGKEQEFVQVNPDDVEKVEDESLLENIARAATQKIGFLRERERKQRADAENAVRAKAAAEKMAYELVARRTMVSEMRKQLQWAGPVSPEDVLDILCAHLVSSGANQSINQLRDLIAAVQASKTIQG